MPNALVHLNVGNKLVKKYKKLDDEKFYLGLITPDSNKINDNLEKSERWRAHLRAKNLDVWEDNVIKFYDDNIDKYDKNYLLGYCIHILTDIVFDRIYFDKNIDQIHQMGIWQDEFEFYHENLRKYEANQTFENWWKEVLRKIKHAKGISINLLSIDEIEKWRDKKLEEYEDLEKCNYGFITEELIDEATKDVEKILIKNKMVDFGDGD